MEVTTAKTEIVGLRLTIELSNTHAAELAGLLSGYVSFSDFPWAQSIYNALERAGIQEEYAFADSEYGPDIFLVRKQAKRMADEERVARGRGTMSAPERSLNEVSGNSGESDAGR